MAIYVISLCRALENILKAGCLNKFSILNNLRGHCKRGKQHLNKELKLLRLPFSANEALKRQISPFRNVFKHE